MLTTQDAVKAQVQYPLPANFFESVMVKRGLDGSAECTKEIMESAEFKGAVADSLKQVILYPSSISEGGMSISKADKNDLLFIANRLYREIGEEPISERPKVTFY
jgi:hypothetical protein